MRMTQEQMEAQASAEYGGPAIGAWPRRPGERLRPHKGGDGGAGDARQMEEERQARIQAATDEINRIFNNQVKQTSTVYRDASGNTITPQQYQSMLAQASATDAQTPARPSGGAQFGIRNNVLASNPGLVIDSSGQSIWSDPYSSVNKFSPSTQTSWVAGDPANSRENLYNEQRSAVYDLNSQDVKRQAEEAARLNRFGLARSGLMGGSVDVDSNSDINRRTNEGLIRAGGIADQAAADLRVSDEQTRGNLISLAQSGIDTGTASQMALQGLKANAASAAGARGGATVGGLFNDMAQAYLYNQQQQGRASGSGQYGSQWYGVSSPTQRYSGA